MKSPLTELNDYVDKVYEMGFTYDPGEVISKLLTLISKLPPESPSLSSAEEAPDLLKSCIAVLAIAEKYSNENWNESREFDLAKMAIKKATESPSKSSAEEAIGELIEALQGLVSDVKNKPNDTRYATHIKIAELVIAKYKQSKK